MKTETAKMKSVSEPVGIGGWPSISTWIKKGRSGITWVEIHLHKMEQKRTQVRSSVFTVIRRDTMLHSVQTGRRAETGRNQR
jgi:hypothetical protein